MNIQLLIRTKKLDIMEYFTATFGRFGSHRNINIKCFYCVYPDRIIKIDTYRNKMSVVKPIHLKQYCVKTELKVCTEQEFMDALDKTF